MTQKSTNQKPMNVLDFLGNPKSNPDEIVGRKLKIKPFKKDFHVESLDISGLSAIFSIRGCTFIESVTLSLSDGSYRVEKGFRSFDGTAPLQVI